MSPRSILAALGSVRRVAQRWRKTSLVLGAIVLGEIGARVGLPDVNGPVLLDYFQGRSGGLLLRLYDWFAGGALARGAVLALGIVPYLSATIMMRLARICIPPVTAMWARSDGPIAVRRWTRYLTVGLSLMQSYGFARFVERLPGVVANPGPGFIAETMVVLTAGAVAVMLVSEAIMSPADDDTVRDELSHGTENEELRAQSLEQPQREVLLLPPGQLPPTELYTSRRAERVPRG